LCYLPVRSAEERLRFYAEQFNTVEVDSTDYALRAERDATLGGNERPTRQYQLNVMGSSQRLEASLCLSI
jgi:hypothetical protein